MQEEYRQIYSLLDQTGPTLPRLNKIQQVARKTDFQSFGTTKDKKLIIS